jgi:hypothetical protein
MDISGSTSRHVSKSSKIQDNSSGGWSLINARDYPAVILNHRSAGIS